MYQKIYKQYIESFHKGNQKINYPFSKYESWYNESNLYKMQQNELSTAFFR